MTALLLYLVTTTAVVALWRRFVQPVSPAVAIALILIPLCFTGRALFTGGVYAPVDLPYMSEPLSDYRAEYGVDTIHNGTLSDLYCQIMPWRKAVRSAIAQGEWPLLNPFMLCGDILAQGAQAAPYDPVNLLSLLIPMAPSLTYSAAMTFFLAAFLTFAFARSLGLGELPSLVAGAGYAFCAVVAFFVGWPLARAWAYMPLVLVGVRVLIEQRNTRGVALLTTGFVLTIFAGHPESILHIVFAGAAYGLFELIARRTWRPIPLAVLAGVLALALTAIFLLPFADAVPQTVEHDVRMKHFRTADFPTMPELIAKRAGLTFFPWFGGGVEGDNFTPLWDSQSGRVGSVTLALALVALLVAPRRRETWFFFALAVFCLCAAMDAPPVAHLLHELPLFDIALNERLAFAGAFALSVLAAIALESLNSQHSWGAPHPAFGHPLPAERGEGRTSTRAGVVVVGVLIALSIGTWMLYPGQLAVGVRTSLLHPKIAAELLPLVVMAVLFFFRAPLRIAVPLVLALLLIQRTLEDGSLYPTIPGHAFYPQVPVLEAIPPTEEPYRMVGMHFSLVPDSSIFYGLQDVRGYQAMTFKRLAQTYPYWSIPQPVSFNAVADVRRPFLSLANVRYALSPGDTNPPEGWRRVMTDRSTSLFENERVLPRAFVPLRIRYEGEDGNVLKAMETATDFGDLSWILAPEVGPHEIANGPGVTKIRADGLAYEIEATMENDGWVVISNSAWKGWRAYLDGRRVNTHFANHAFLGVFVPRGTHRLRMVYLPDSFTRGRTITFSTLAALILFAAWKSRRAMRRTPATSH